MALQNSQIANLNALNQKISTGYVPTAQDTANLNFAKTQGYNYTPMNAGATKISNPLDLKGLTENQIYRSGADIYKLPTTISSDKITGGSTPNINAATPTGLSDVNAYMEASKPETSALKKQLEIINQPVQQETQVNEFNKRYNEINSNLLNKGVDQQAELDKYNLDPLKSQMTDYQGKLNLSAENVANIEKQYDTLTNESLKNPTLASIGGNQRDAILREKAVQVGFEKAKASIYQSALTGNKEYIAYANEQAKNAIDIKYKPQEDYLANLKNQIDNAYKDLDRADKKKADSLLAATTERARLLQDQKDKETKIAAIMLAAAKGGADATTLKNVQNATSEADAVAKAGGFLKEASKGQLQDLGNGNYYDPSTGTVKTTAQLSATANLGNPVGTIMGLTSYDTRTANPGVNRSNRNNNPGNIKVSDYTKNFPGVVGVESSPAQDGGNFLIFDSPESGINAIGQLLLTGKSYKGLTAEQAIKKYNGNGSYGASSVGLIPTGDFIAQISDQTKLKTVAEAIAKAEGFTGVRSSTTSSNAKNMADAIIAGNAKLTDVPQKDRASVITEIQKSGKNVAEIEQKQATAENTKAETLTLINNMLNSGLIGNATGIMSWTTKIPGTGTYSFGRSFEQLRDLLAMGNIDKLKGAMSDKDIEFLRNSATKLALGLPKDEFITELNKLKLRLENPTSSANTTQSSTPITTGTTGTTSSGIGYTIE